jgi:phosphatidate cytidylyltransferase
MSFRQRTSTAVVLLGLLFILVQFAPPWAFFIVVQVFVLAALLELYGLARRKKLEPRPVPGIVFALLIGASFLWPGLPLGLALSLGLLLAGAYYLVTTTTLERVMIFPGSLAVTIFGALYVSFPLGFLYPIRVERGPYYLYFLLAVIFIGDTGAYAVGKLIGRHKLAPLASPNKTWEGVVGGLAAAGLGALAAAALLLKDVPPLRAAICGLLVHAVAQISDPVESLFKRAVGVKDSSGLLPGHGGFLDRIDSFLFAAPFFYFYLRFFWK